ncbi:NADH-quinone oxidoreductase subunit NuoA, partial [Escherichia coli]|nr:NADH-quinone oxidoreductase subunit NuoA [Escherichia coli]
STSTEGIAHHWAFAIFLIVAIGLCCLMLVGGWFLGGRGRARSKNVPFVSGIDSVGAARLRLSAKVYLVAQFFVIFDVGALVLV